MDMPAIHPRLGDIDSHYRHMRAAMAELTREELELVLYGTRTDAILNIPPVNKASLPFPSVEVCDAAVAANVKLSELLATAERFQLERN